MKKSLILSVVFVLMTSVSFAPSVSFAQGIYIPPPPFFRYYPIVPQTAKQNPKEEGSTQKDNTPDVDTKKDNTVPATEVDPEVQSCLQEINEYRVLNKVPVLTLDPDLCLMAKIHCQRMQSAGFLYHSNYGLPENIAMGNISGVATYKQWLFSPPHCANLRRVATRVGLYRVGIFWVYMVK